VVQVTIGEVHGQGVRIASRCLWDTETDNHASSTFQNPYLYCVAMVFAVYFEVMSRLSRHSRFLPHAVFAVTLATAHLSLHITLPPVHVASSIIFHGWSGKFSSLPVRVGAPACNCILLPSFIESVCMYHISISRDSMADFPISAVNILTIQLICVLPPCSHVAKHCRQSIWETQVQLSCKFEILSWFEV
jgi:hypothetical protein